MPPIVKQLDGVETRATALTRPGRKGDTVLRRLWRRAAEMQQAMALLLDSASSWQLETTLLISFLMTNSNKLPDQGTVGSESRPSRTRGGRKLASTAKGSTLQLSGWASATMRLIQSRHSIEVSGKSSCQFMDQRSKMDPIKASGRPVLQSQCRVRSLLLWQRRVQRLRHCWLQVIQRQTPPKWSP